MNATVAELPLETREMIRAVVRRGEELILTESGQPIAKIVPFMRTFTVSPGEALSGGKLTDEAILKAIHEARDERDDHLGRA